MTNVAPVTAGATPGNLTQEQWAIFLIEQINAEGGSVPLTANNVQNIERWMTAENPASNWAPRNNPLNASLGTTASDGTAGYKNLTEAANYTAQMILQQNMSSIYKALASNASPTNFSAGVVTSAWAGGRYGVAAAGAPKQYIVPGRGLDYISTIPLPQLTSVGSIISKLPADAGGVVPASPTPIPLGNGGVNVGAGVAAPFTDIESFFSALGNGFGLGWAGIFTIMLGIAMIGVGMIFLFRKQAVKIGSAALAA